MPNQSWVALGNPSGSYTLLNNGAKKESFTALADISPGLALENQAVVLPPITSVGTLIRCTASGTLNNEAEETEWRLAVCFEGAAGKQLASTEKMKTPSAAKKRGWYLQTLSRVASLSGSAATATVVTQGFVTGLDTGTTNNSSIVSSLSPEEKETEKVVTISTAGGKVITLAAECSKSAAGNNITVYNWVVELLN